MNSDRSKAGKGSISRRFSGIIRMVCILTAVSMGSCSDNTNNVEEPYDTAEEVVQASLDAMGWQADREILQNLVSLADCVSPKGKYATEIHTGAGGYSYFKQSYTYSPDVFEAIIVDGSRGFQAGDTSHALDKKIVSMIRGHHFHNIPLEIKERFHDFQKPIIVDTGTVGLYQVGAKDELGLPCTIFFDRKSGLIRELHTQNPGDAKDIIRTVFSDWRPVQRLQLPFRVDIYQGGKEYLFEYTSVVINDRDFQYKNKANLN